MARFEFQMKLKTRLSAIFCVEQLETKIFIIKFAGANVNGERFSHAMCPANPGLIVKCIKIDNSINGNLIT